MRFEYIKCYDEHDYFVKASFKRGRMIFLIFCKTTAID